MGIEKIEYFKKKSTFFVVRFLLFSEDLDLVADIVGKHMHAYQNGRGAKSMSEHRKLS